MEKLFKTPIDETDDQTFVDIVNILTTSFTEIETGFFKADRTIRLSEVVAYLNKEKIAFNLTDYWGRKIIQLDNELVIDFENEKWDKRNELIKIKEQEYFEFIGIRYFHTENDFKKIKNNLSGRSSPSFLVFISVKAQNLSLNHNWHGLGSASDLLLFM